MYMAWVHKCEKVVYAWNCINHKGEYYITIQIHTICTKNTNCYLHTKICTRWFFTLSINRSKNAYIIYYISVIHYSSINSLQTT
jgi:hypothetical protein